METELWARSEDLTDAERSGGCRPRIGDRFRLALSLVGKQQRATFLLLIGARVLVGLCDLLLAGGTYILFLRLQGAAVVHHGWWTPKTTLSAAVVTTGLVLLRVVFDLISTRAVVGQIQEFYNDLLLRLTDGYNHMKWVRFVQRNRSELLNHAMTTAREAANVYHLGIEIAAGVVVMLGMAAVFVYQSPAAACVLGISGGLLYLAHRFLIRSELQRAASEREEAVRMLQRGLADVFSSGKEVRSYRVQSFFQQRIASQARIAASSYRRVVLPPQIARVLTDQGAILLFLCAVIAVQLRHGDVRRLLSLLVFYFVLSRRLLPLISQVSFMAGQMEGSFKNVQIIARELKESYEQRAPRTSTRTIDGDLVAELEQVCFGFDDGELLLRNVNIRLRQGETAWLRGISGSGKSSLVHIIAGMLEPTSGVVRVDQTKIAYVPQEVVLLDESIRSNLLFGRKCASDADLWRALEIACLRDFVVALPFGLDTQIGDNGVLISGGQRQRMGLARAMVGDTNLLLLDEATSGLDEETESMVLRNLRASGVAVLLVSHRTPKHSFAQRILRLEHGSLTEESIEKDRVWEGEAVNVQG